MARFTGFCCTQPMASAKGRGILDRIPGVFGFAHPGIAKTEVADPRSGDFLFGLLLVEEGSSDDELRTRIIRRGEKLYAFDGEPYALGERSLDGLALADRYALLADEWGRDPLHFPSRLKGNCVGLSYDSRARTLKIFNDRFCVRRIYYHITEGTLYFSSEIKGVLSSSGIARRVNLGLFGRYISMNYRMLLGRGETFFEGVSEMPVASCMEFAKGAVRFDRYWNPPDKVFPISMGEDTFVDLYRKKLDVTMDRCLNRARRPLFFVSGGLDSPTVAVKAFEHLGGRIDCCAGTFKGHADFDESGYITSLTDKIARKVRLFDVTAEDFLKTYHSILSRHDQPVFAANFVFSYQMLELAQSMGYDSAFGGGGGDRVAHGCLEYQLYLLGDYYMAGEKVFQRELDAWCRRVGPYLRYWPKDPERSREWMLKLIDPSSPGKISNNPDWIKVDRRAFGDRLLPAEVVAPDVECRYGTFRQSRIAEDIFHQTDPVQHLFEDINGSGLSILPQDPLWDLDLVEFGFQLPVEMLLNDGWTKTIVRRATKGLLPDALRLRPDKTGLGLPLDAWFRSGPLREEFEDIVDSSFMTEEGLFNPDAVRTAFREHIDNKDNHGGFLWKAFAAHHWYNKWVKGKG